MKKVECVDKQKIIRRLRSCYHLPYPDVIKSMMEFEEELYNREYDVDRMIDMGPESTNTERLYGDIGEMKNKLEKQIIILAMNPPGEHGMDTLKDVCGQGKAIDEIMKMISSGKYNNVL